MPERPQPDEAGHPGWLLGIFVRVFRVLQYCSIEILITRNLPEERRDRWTDSYVAAWLVIEAGVLLFLIGTAREAGRMPGPWVFCISALFGYRLVDIMQAVLNLVIFQPARTRRPIGEVQRTFLLGVINFVEATLIFTVGRYLSGPDFSPPIDDWWKAFYSTLTQATLIDASYTPLEPFARAIATLQTTITSVLLLVLLAWVVGHLPAPGKDDRRANGTGGPAQDKENNNEDL